MVLYIHRPSASLRALIINNSFETATRLARVRNVVSMAGDFALSSAADKLMVVLLATA